MVGTLTPGGTSRMDIETRGHSKYKWISSHIVAHIYVYIYIYIYIAMVILYIYKYIYISCYMVIL